jgi:uncharacterized protein YbjT (DUF2867 family)
MKNKTALVVGATGLVGNELVKILLASPQYERVIIWVRKTTGISDRKLQEKIIDFAKLENYKIEANVDHVFCCLGTTIKKAGTQKAFAKVDLEYPLVLGRLAEEKGVSQFLVISAMGAQVNSRIFYNKTKGQLEMGLRKIGLNGLHIFRPSLLIGKRDGFRFGESAAALISKLLPFMFSGQLKKYKPIRGRDVAYAMYITALEEKGGTYVYTSNEISKRGQNNGRI